MVMVTSRRLLAAAILPLVLAACTRTAGQRDAGTGTTATAAGSGFPAPGGRQGLAAVRHVWGHRAGEPGIQTELRHPSADPYLAVTLPRMGRCWKTTTGSATPVRPTTSRRSPGKAPPWPPRPTSRSGLRPPRHLGHRPQPQGRQGRPVRRPSRRFAFFASVTANPAFWAAHILSFRPLPGDLARASTTPAFSFIVPNLCDGHDASCVTGAAGGLTQARSWRSGCRRSWPRRPTRTAA